MAALFLWLMLDKSRTRNSLIPSPEFGGPEKRSSRDSVYPWGGVFRVTDARESGQASRRFGQSARVAGVGAP
jgi:hypothetical protein